MSNKPCPKCGGSTVEKFLFTSTYAHCEPCENPSKAKAVEVGFVSGTWRRQGDWVNFSGPFSGPGIRASGAPLQSKLLRKVKVDSAYSNTAIISLEVNDQVIYQYANGNLHMDRVRQTHDYWVQVTDLVSFKVNGLEHVDEIKNASVPHQTAAQLRHCRVVSGDPNQVILEILSGDRLEFESTVFSTKYDRVETRNRNAVFEPSNCLSVKVNGVEYLTLLQTLRGTTPANVTTPKIKLFSDLMLSGDLRDLGGPYYELRVLQGENYLFDSLSLGRKACTVGSTPLMVSIPKDVMWIRFRGVTYFPDPVGTTP